jgi:hypothetical protein
MGFSLMATQTPQKIDLMLAFRHLYYRDTIFHGVMALG